MAGSSKSSAAPRPRKRVDAETNSLKRAKDGSAFTRCEECKKDVPVVLIDMHSCSLDSKIKMHLESQIVEKVVEPKKPASKKRLASTSTEKKGKKSKGKAKDPNMPKRPVSAFFVFMEEFRVQYKEDHPGANAGPVVAKEGGQKWKSMTDEEKKPYVDVAAERKAEYEKAMEKYKAECDEDKDDDEVQEVDDEEEQEAEDEQVQEDLEDKMDSEKEE